MASEFSTEFFSANRIVKADLRAARTPREEDLERIKKEVAKLYDATEVILNVTVDDSLLSGYVLQIGDRVFDNSGRHAIDQMMADKPSLATLKTRIEDYKPAATSEEGGVVILRRRHRGSGRHGPRRLRRDRHLREWRQGHGGERRAGPSGHHALRRR